MRNGAGDPVTGLRHSSGEPDGLPLTRSEVTFPDAPTSGSDSWNLDSRPGVDIALRAGIVPCAGDRTVGTQAKGVSGTRRYRDDILPIADVALLVAVVSGCEDPSGCRDSDGVVAARGQRHCVFPLIDVARSGGPVPGRKDPPVAPVEVTPRAATVKSSRRIAAVIRSSQHVMRVNRN